MIKKLIYLIAVIWCALSVDEAYAQIKKKQEDAIAKYNEMLLQTYDPNWNSPEAQRERHAEKFWKGHRSYINLGYNMQSLSKGEEFGGGTWKAEWGINYSQGYIFYLHKKPLFGKMMLGLDWSIVDFNFVKYKDKFNTFGLFPEDLNFSNYYNDIYDYGSGYNGDRESVDVTQFEYSMQFGPVVSVNPFGNVKTDLYFKVAPSFSMLKFKEENYFSYGTFFVFGGEIGYKRVSFGVEGRWGNTKYDNLYILKYGQEGALSDIVNESIKWGNSNWDTYSLNDGGNWNGIGVSKEDLANVFYGVNEKVKWKTGCLRFFISIRLGR